MNYLFYHEAKEEFNAVIDYYEECKTGLGLEFANEVRRCLANRFPFGVIYY